MSDDSPHGPSDLPVHDPLRPDEHTLNGELLRAVMRRTVSPVTVVTATADGESRAATIGSFTSVSLDPPLVSFNVIRGTSFHTLIARADRAAIHLLADDQAELAERFAIPDLTEAEQFGDVAFGRAAACDPPVLEGTLGVLLVAKSDMHPAGDHDIVVCEVTGISLPELEPRKLPLLYFARSYRTVGQQV